MASRTQQEIRDLLGVRVQVGEIVTISNAELLWPNFSGAKDKYNAEGDRNFNLRLSQELADELTADGWNVKCKLARPEDPDSGERCVLKVTVNFGNKPPKIIQRGSITRRETQLHEGIAGLMDSADIVTADVSFVPYFWDVNGSVGMTAYLKTLYCVIQEDELDLKWNSEDIDPVEENLGD